MANLLFILLCQRQNLEIQNKKYTNIVCVIVLSTLCRLLNDEVSVYLLFLARPAEGERVRRRLH